MEAPRLRRRSAGEVDCPRLRSDLRGVDALGCLPERSLKVGVTGAGNEQMSASASTTRLMRLSNGTLNAETSARFVAPNDPYRTGALPV